jgi:zinc and cadmium transporter
MTWVGPVALYSVAILFGAAAGAALALATGKKARLVALLAFAAGVMLGAAFFHMLPEAFHLGGYVVFTWVPVGFLVLFVLERYVLAHACEEPPDCEEHVHGRALGLTAFLGLSAHTLFDGIALGSAVREGIGLIAFTAILAHKLPSSLSLAAILRAEGKRKRSVMLFTIAYGLMVPAGAVIYFFLDSLVTINQFAAKALALSAGTFLYIAVSDLLPHINRHAEKGRMKHVFGLVLGLGLMFALKYVTGHSHTGH